jgi:2-haloacid dehalogenase
MGRYKASTITQMLMIAAHGWDIAGAAHAGLATGFITREGQAILCPLHLIL